MATSNQVLIAHKCQESQEIAKKIEVFFHQKVVSLIARGRTNRGSTVIVCGLYYFEPIRMTNKYSNKILCKPPGIRNA